jgi:hypothetical protein
MKPRSGNYRKETKEMTYPRTITFSAPDPLVKELADLVNGADPRKILLMTFSRRAGPPARWRGASSGSRAE